MRRPYMLRRRRPRGSFTRLRALCSALTLAAASPGQTLAASSAAPADLVVSDAVIHTADARRSVAESLAVRDGRFIFVGPAEGARAYVGPKTTTERPRGRLVLPGLFDSHLHPIAMIKVDACDLANQAKTLRELSGFVRDCAQRSAEGGWLSVHQWNAFDGNQPDADYPTLVAALDRASTRVPIQLIGTDGHHGAFNSNVLARAKNTSGTVVGFTKASLAKEFSAYRKVIGVDAEGNPNGAVNEAAKALMGAPSILLAEFDRALELRDRLPVLLNSAGITGILDAKVSPEILALYDSLQREHRLAFRTNIAQLYDPDRYTQADGRPGYSRMLRVAEGIRARYAGNPLIRADFVKLFADGVMEGNPYAVPPTLPNALSSRPYLQPIFGRDHAGELTVTGRAGDIARTHVLKTWFQGRPVYVRAAP